MIVIGDAAHAMPPTGGQGAAMAFEDALTLADALSRLADKDSPTNDEIRQWQTVRQQRVKEILKFTSRGGDMRKASVSTFAQIVKEWIMWAYFLWKGPDAGISWIYNYDTTKIGR